ncbi:MAG: PaaX family transcriptional regulator C-terminal domain-containing protein [Pseudomonadota bacterium]
MNAPATEPSLRPDLAALLEELRPKANSLIVTVFGDAIMPRGGTIWLSDLVHLMALFGLSERHVRTGVYRLSQEGWLTSQTEGRRARYTLSGEGLRRFAEADQRIYALGKAEASDQWTLVQGLADLVQSERQALRRTLKWLGFGQLSTSLMALPAPAPPGLSAALEAAGLQDRVVVFHSSVAPGFSRSALPNAAVQAWPLGELSTEYETFANRFRSLVTDPDHLTGQSAFAARVLLIHEYRRILLKDPHLPSAFLPGEWAGTAAKELCSGVYRAVVNTAEDWLSQTLSAPAKAAPTPASEFWQRFSI